MHTKMFTRTLFFVWFVIILFAQYVCKIDQFHPYPNFAKHIEKACKNNDICKNSKEESVAKQAGRKCCQDCSCKSNCGLKQDCCYPELDMYNVMDRRHQKCIIPVQISPTQITQNYVPVDIAYHMVVDAFPGQPCVNSKGDGGIRCGDDESATPLGSLYPVSSLKTNTIYKNIKCAMCHGLEEADVIPWNVFIECTSVYSSIQPDINTFFQSLENGQMLPTCSLRFQYPGAYTDLRVEECYNHAIQTCLPNNSFVVPEFLGMTHVEVRKACYSNLQSPYIFNGIYANVFCFICNVNYNLTTIRSRCRDASWKDFGKSSFISIISPEFIHVKTRSTDESSQNKRLICSNTDSQTMPKDCRYIQCPSGKVMTKNGICVYPSKISTFGAFRVVLKLSPATSLSVDSIENFTSHFWKTSNIISPWQKEWVLTHLLYKRDDTLTKVDYFVAYFIRDLQKSFEMMTFVSDIRSKMKKSWDMQLAEGSVQLKQSFSPYSDIKPINGTSSKLYSLNISAIMSVLPDTVENITLPVLEELLADGRITKVLSIDKMFYCDQIALKPDEYKLHKEARILYHKPTQRIFFDNEFSMVYDMAGGDFVPRICLSDSGLTNIGQHSANTAWNNHTQVKFSLTFLLTIGLLQVICLINRTIEKYVLP